MKIPHLGVRTFYGLVHAAKQYYVYKPRDRTANWQQTTIKKVADVRDIQEIASYAQDSIQYLISKGIVSGDGQNINPSYYAKRAEVAALLYKVLGELNE